MKKMPAAATALTLCGVLIMLSVFSVKAKAGAQNGMAVCENIVIPSLLPVLCVANLMLKSKASAFFEAIFGFAARWLKLPASAVTPLLFGMIAGFPAGAVLTAAQYENGALTREQARRMMAFNFCGGTAFCITAVGTSYYHSAKAGALLYGASVLSAVLIAAALTPFADLETKNTAQTKRLPFAEALCEAVQKTCETVLLMSGFIILFCALTALLPLPQKVLPLLEITTGLFSGSAPLPLPLCAFFLNFGGLCIHLQLIAPLRKMHVSYCHFFICRVGASVLAWGMVKIYLLFFPEAATASVNGAEAVVVQFAQTSTAAGVLTLLGCVWLILDLENKKLRL